MVEFLPFKEDVLVRAQVFSHKIFSVVSPSLSESLRRRRRLPEEAPGGGSPLGGRGAGSRTGGGGEKVIGNIGQVIRLVMVVLCKRIG